MASQAVPSVDGNGVNQLLGPQHHLFDVQQAFLKTLLELSMTLKTKRDLTHTHIAPCANLARNPIFLS